MSKVNLPDGFVYKEISLHHSLTETDMLCSVPMMKTHGLAAVTLGMKNVIGLYPGNEIEIRGTKLADVGQNFLRPTIYPWDAIRNCGPPC